MIIAGTVA